MPQHGSGTTTSRPPASSTRRAVEQRSAVLLVFMRGLPAVVVPACAAVLLVAGLAVRGPGGAVALVLLAAFLGWFGYLSWPIQNAPGRFLRTLVPVVLLGLAIYQALR